MWSLLDMGKNNTMRKMRFKLITVITQNPANHPSSPPSYRFDSAEEFEYIPESIQGMLMHVLQFSITQSSLLHKRGCLPQDLAWV